MHDIKKYRIGADLRSASDSLPSAGLGEDIVSLRDPRWGNYMTPPGTLLSCRCRLLLGALWIGFSHSRDVP